MSLGLQVPLQQGCVCWRWAESCSVWHRADPPPVCEPQWWKAHQISGLEKEEIRQRKKTYSWVFPTPCPPAGRATAAFTQPALFYFEAAGAIKRRGFFSQLCSSAVWETSLQFLALSFLGGFFFGALSERGLALGDTGNIWERSGGGGRGRNHGLPTRPRADAPPPTTHWRELHTRSDQAPAPLGQGGGSRSGWKCRITFTHVCEVNRFLSPPRTV